MSDIKIVEDNGSIEYVKDNYTGYVGEIFKDGAEYGYYIQIFKDGSPIPRLKESFKTKEEAIDAVKKVLSSSQ